MKWLFIISAYAFEQTDPVKQEDTSAQLEIQQCSEK